MMELWKCLMENIRYFKSNYESRSNSSRYNKWDSENLKLIRYHIRGNKLFNSECLRKFVVQELIK